MKKVLMITHKIFPLDAGDSLYNYGLCKELCKHVNLTIFSYLAENYDSTKIAFPDKCCDEIYFFHNKGYNKKLDYIANKAGILTVDRSMLNRIKLEIINNKIDYIVINHIVMAQYAKILKKEFPDLSFIYISHDVETQNKLEEYKYSNIKRKSLPHNIYRFLLNKRSVELHRYYEKFLLQNSIFNFSISKTDIELHKRMFKNISPTYFCKPLIPFNRVKKLDDLKVFNKKLLIVGTMSWYPNTQGILWFVENVFSLLIKQDKEYKLYLVGNKPSLEILKLQERYPDNIIVTGRVPSTDKYFNICDISIIPLFVGTGAKIKVLESIARGIPIICSSYAAKDYNIKGEILIANTPEEFIEKIQMLEESSSLRKELFEEMINYYDNYMQLDNQIIELFKR